MWHVNFGLNFKTITCVMIFVVFFFSMFLLFYLNYVMFWAEREKLVVFIVCCNRGK